MANAGVPGAGSSGSAIPEAGSRTALKEKRDEEMKMSAEDSRGRERERGAEEGAKSRASMASRGENNEGIKRRGYDFLRTR